MASSGGPLDARSWECETSSAMSLLIRIAEQFRRPEGLLGKVVAWLMERGNRPANEWVLDRLELRPGDHVLEMGFGPGSTIPVVLERAAQGRYVGVDFSAAMVEQARRRHAAAIASRRVEVHLGDLAALPDGDASFDKVFAVNVLYFLPDPVASLRTLRRLMKPGGRLALFIREKEALAKMPFTRTSVFRYYTPEEAMAVARDAGFTRVWFETRPFERGTGHCVLAEG